MRPSFYGSVKLRLRSKEDINREAEDKARKRREEQDAKRRQAEVPEL
jgi:hypothetical protein